jgi:hypothetical protein
MGLGRGSGGAGTRADGGAPEAHYPDHFDTLGDLGLIYLAVLIFVVGGLLSIKPLLEERRKETT